MTLNGESKVALKADKDVSEDQDHDSTDDDGKCVSTTKPASAGSGRWPGEMFVDNTTDEDDYEDGNVREFGTEKEEPGPANGRVSAGIEICKTASLDLGNQSDKQALKSVDHVMNDDRSSVENSDRTELSTLEIQCQRQQEEPPDPRILKQRNRISALSTQILQIQAEINTSRAGLGNPSAAETIARHIALLHEYNEIRDVGLGLMGMIAERRRIRVGEVMKTFGVETRD